jgi:hypothetical protein
MYEPSIFPEGEGIFLTKGHRISISFLTLSYRGFKPCICMVRVRVKVRVMWFGLGGGD